ncbi:MAG: hypothetical protein ACYC4Q_04810 [Victivallaceae bacterium]
MKLSKDRPFNKLEEQGLIQRFEWKTSWMICCCHTKLIYRSKGKSTTPTC